ncbi:hypothetical protein D3C83_236590 [compost metagenome]
MIAKIRSFALTPNGSAPSTVMRMFFGLRCHSACVASTCSMSEEPIPNARQPNA